ncbi:MAG: adenine methyltransferase YhdJ [Chloroflexi bacterium]|nr:adenine methyltransferase YhdJ [Chloroflexota bacterium]
MKDYQDFIATKRPDVQPAGFEISPDELHVLLFDFQAAAVRWALRRGRAAVFFDTGLGKTLIECEFARQVYRHTGRNVLILAPLAVAKQTVAEADKFGITVKYCRQQSEVEPGITIANYEMLQHFTADQWSGLVLDESSCLKAFGGVMRKQITVFGAAIPFRLACTATPAPNDLVELTNHAEFLNIMTGKEIIALFFTQDGNTTHAWRLKGHAREDFYRWLATWSIAARKPSDLGFDDTRFVLPPLRMHQTTIAAKGVHSTLFAVEAQTLQERQRARRASIGERVAAATDMVNASTNAWLVWCDLNDESRALAKAIPDAVEVTGSDSPEHKERAMLDFAAGRIRVLVSKPSICGFGMNFQRCAHMAFVGISDSFEQQYQAIRRCWRFGQTRPVNVHVIAGEQEGAVVRNIERKARQFDEMMDQLVVHMRDLQMGGAARMEMTYERAETTGTDWRMILGDSVETIAGLEADSVGLVVTSPPFPGMYTYSNSARDIGNTTTIDEMIAHFRYLIGAEGLLRVVMPGRMCAIHLMQLTAMKSREGYIGLHDYRGRVIQMMIEAGWVYAGEVTIDKNPQVQATRNKERGLLFKSLATDSSMMRMALADYLIYFRKPGQNPIPIQAGRSPRYNPDGGWITEREWIEWAAPVWYRETKDLPGGIRETDVLNVLQAQETDDERHLCPLQLGVIERAIKLWSAPGDLVLDPFAGIGSVLYQALLLRRRAVGLELKRSYFETACTNAKRGLAKRNQGSLFDMEAVS